ncbi:MAG: class I SAM-dependent methyltransferase [Desulfomonilaceae bacterium]|nr:class I SAM-dependent methyltransferase [Desulfomonilaceae bacterium]
MTPEQFELHANIEDKHWWFVGRREIIRRVVFQIAPPSKDFHIVDVGCGTGGNLGVLARHYACTGLDDSAEGIELAKKRFPETKFICGSAQGDMEELGGLTDLLLLLDVLEHVAFDREFLVNLLNHVKPKGHILLTVPADMSLWSPHDVHHGHYRRYELSDLEELCSSLPASLIFISYFNTFLYPIVRIVRTVTRCRNREYGLAGTDLSLPPHFLNGLLAKTFSWEGRFLTSALKGRRRSPFVFGVSLMALLRKEQGSI